MPKVKKIYSQALGLRKSASQAEKAWLVSHTAAIGVYWSYYPFVDRLDRFSVEALCYRIHL